MADSVIQLRCSCSNSPWGKKGSDSVAARLSAQTPGTNFKTDPNVEYAELWMGTYPDAPSHVLSSGKRLQDVLAANKEKLIGKTVLDRFGADLPFLPKILSIAKALPLQFHPHEQLAAQLHRKDPQKYSNNNHKPEIAIALSKFECFVGFKPLYQIQELFKLKPLKRFNDIKNIPFDNQKLKRVCRLMLLAPESVVRETQDALLKLPREAYGKQAYILDLLPRLQKQYTKADNGTLVALICLNYLVLQPGDAIYVPEDDIHAYLSGDVVECLARSDQVIETGLCPQADRNSVDLFTGALTFAQRPVANTLLGRVISEKSGNKKTWVYAPPTSEFNVLVSELGAADKETVHAVWGPSIMFVTSGFGMMVAGGKEIPLQEGYIFFIGQGVEIELSTDERLVAYRAYAE